MELKRCWIQDLQGIMKLLIVPYGIETGVFGLLTQLVELLIVPYGIETIVTDEILNEFGRLLIVPYGIETI